MSSEINCLFRKKIDKKSVIVTVSVCHSSKNGTAKNRFPGFLVFSPSLIRGVTVTSKKLISGNLKAVYSYKYARKISPLHANQDNRFRSIGMYYLSVTKK